MTGTAVAPAAMLDQSEQWSHAGLLLVERIARQQPAADPDIREMQEACRRYLRADGFVSLERCLGIPKTFKEFRRAGRDYHLGNAARQLLRDDPAATCGHLAEHWRRFVGDGRYQQWCDDARPPEYASPLSVSLFYATRYARQEGSAARYNGVLTRRQLARVVGHFFSEKCPAP